MLKLMPLLCSEMLIKHVVKDGNNFLVQVFGPRLFMLYVVAFFMIQRFPNIFVHKVYLLKLYTCEI